MTDLLSGLKPILGRYRLAIIDQWGVLHNGVKPFPGAIDAMTALHRTGTNIIILSNSGKLAAHSHTLIGRMGFAMEQIHRVISSGQAAREWLLERQHPLSLSLGKKLLFWGFDEDYSAINGMDLERLDDIAEVDFILAAGAGRGTLDAYQEEMDIGIKRGIPMLCTNPDLVANTPDGSLKICPGSLAQYYEQRGGQVVRFGKPAPEVYDMCFREFPDIAKDKKLIIGIGDSLDHDIGGANGVGIDSLFIMGGIHESDFCHGVDWQRTKELFANHRVQPTYMVDGFNL